MLIIGIVVFIFCKWGNNNLVSLAEPYSSVEQVTRSFRDQLTSRSRLSSLSMNANSLANRFESHSDTVGLLFYERDSLTYWENPPEFNLTELNDGQWHFKLNNKNSLFFSKQLKVSGNLVLVGQGRLSFAHELKFKKVNEVLSMQSSFDNHTDNVPNNNTYPIALLLIFLFITLSAMLCINDVANHIGNKYSPEVGALVLVVGMIMVRFLYGIPYFTQEFSELQVTLSVIQSKYLGSSIMGFLLNSMMFLWIIIYYYKAYQKVEYTNINKTTRWLLAAFNYLSILLGIIMVAGIIKSIVMESSINFDFEKLFSLNFMSLMAISGMMIVCTALFLFSQRMMFNIKQLNLEKRFRLLGMLIAALFSCLGLLYFQVIDLNLRFLIFGLIYLLLLDFYADNDETDFTWMLIWLIIFSSFSAALLFNYNSKKELINQKTAAKILLNPQDYILESRVNSASTKSILEDPYLQNYYKNLQKEDVVIQFWHETGIKNISWALESKTGIPIYRIKRDYNTVFLRGKDDPSSALFYINDPKKLPSYKGVDLPIGTNVKFFFKNQAITEWNVGSKVTIPVVGEFIINGLPNPEYKLEDSNRRSIILKREQGGWIKMFGLFSFLFVLLLLSIGVTVVLNTFFKVIPDTFHLLNSASMTLRNKIQISVIALILASSIAIGMVTFMYFKAADRKNQQALFEKDRKHILAFYENLTKQDTLSKEKTSIFSGFIDIPVFCYNNTGKLVSWSDQIFEPDIKLMSRIPISPKLLQRNNNLSNRFTYYNRSFEFYKINPYSARNQYYVVIPLNYSKIEKKTGLSDFIGTIINTYVFLLLIASALALTVGRSITKPLFYLVERLKNVKVGSMNKPLEWKNKDEIGVLVQAYNDMIKKLDDSAQLLAKSEREGAWRDMAQQVAHEIKNPLTPMKLNIQYLLHSYDSEPEKREEKIRRISGVLIQQIDNLAHIANTFSQFARDSDLQLKDINLNELITGVYNLFKTEAYEKGVDLNLTMPIEPIDLVTDSNNLLRVINNLIKNALQALEHQTGGKIDISVDSKDSHITILIKDNGPGISDEIKSMIFEPHFTTKSSGSGLGLAMCKRLIEQLGGQIDFQSNLNQGCTFVVKLPINTTV